MSEVLRNYTWGGNPRRRRRDLRRRSRGAAKFLFPLLVILLLWGLWATRDHYPMSDLIPRERGIELYINNIIDRREDIVKSHVWNLLPESSEGRRLLALLGSAPPVPEWLLNNLSAGVTHACCADLERAPEMVVVTRMTRIGSIAERLARFLPQVQRDLAGGLRLRHIPELNLHYAVRGRMFVITRSRDALIRALTLPDAVRLSSDEFAEGVRMAGGADVFCRVVPTGWAPDFVPFDHLSFALRFEQKSAHLAVRGEVSPEFQHRYASLLPRSGPAPLPAPLDAIASVSLDFGVPLPELVEALVALYLDIPEYSLFETVNSETEIASAAALFLAGLQTVKSRTRLAWFDIDHTEMLPIPLVAAVADADTQALAALFERIPAPPDSVRSYDLIPRFDEESMIAHVPFIGGQNIQPTVAVYGDGVVFSSSLPLARELQESPALSRLGPQEGNLYIHFKPDAAFDAVMRAAAEFAASGLLRGHDEKSLATLTTTWMPVAHAMEDIALIASIVRGEVRAEMKLRMRAVSDREFGDSSTTTDGGDVIQ